MKNAPWTLLGKLRELRRNERGTRAQLEALQLKKFRQLALHASLHSPHYAQVVRDHRIDLPRCVPGDFPVLTKAELIANFDAVAVDRRITRRAVEAFLAQPTGPDAAFLDRYRVIHSSGSSGQIGFFVYSAADWARAMAQQSRLRPAIRVKPFGRDKHRLAYYGAVEGHFAGVSMVRAATRGFGRFAVDLRLLEINSPVASVIAELNAFRPEYLIGYVSALKTLAHHQRQGLLHISPRELRAVGEGLTGTDRQLLQCTFACDVTAGYACSEHLAMGHLDAQGDRMVLRDDDLIFEFHADHSIVTNLFNWTMPLIRYQMTDVLRPLPPRERSAPYLEIDSLVGRSEAPLILVNAHGEGDAISPFTIAEMFVAGVSGMQVRRVDRTCFRLAVHLDPSLCPRERDAAVARAEARMREILDRKNMSNVRFTVEVVDELPLDPQSRKFRLIDDAGSDAVVIG